MFCVECGKEIPDGVKFCPDCGASQIDKVIEEDETKLKGWTTQKGIEESKKKEKRKKGKRDYSKLKIPELKEILKEKKLPISGYKPELIERLTDPDWRKKQKIPWLYRQESIKEAKKDVTEVEDEEGIMSGGRTLLGLLLLFYLQLVYYNYLDIKEASSRRLSDGSYTPEKEITEFTSEEIMQILITNNNNAALWFPFLILFLLVLAGIVFVVLETGIDSWSQSAVSNNQPFFLLYIVSFLIPIVGIIIGAIYLINKDKATQNAGTTCLLVSIGSFLLVLSLFFR